MSKLTQRERDALPDAAFAVPAKRLLPIHDREHAELAWRMVDRTEGLTAEERAKARQRIIAALRRFGVDTSGYRIEQACVEPLAEVLEATNPRPDRLEVEVSILKPGLSRNRWRYSEAVLREAVPLFEGAAAFCDHRGPLDRGRAGYRSVRDLVGVYSDVRYEDGIRATLRFYPGAEWLYRIVEAAIADRQVGRAAPNIGISGDMVVAWEPVIAEDRGQRARMTAREVKAIKAVQSADVVFRPSAGGGFERVVSEGERALEAEGEDLGDIYTRGGTAVTEVVEAEGLERDVVGPAMEAEAQVEALRAARRAACAELLAIKLAASGLPQAAQEAIRDRFKDRVFEAEELDRAVGSMRELLGQLVQGGVVQGMGEARASESRVAVGKTPLEKLQMAMDRLFGLPVEDPSVPRLSGIREAYLLITGDKEFTGRYNWDESIVREASEVTTAAMANVVATTMTKRLVKDYQAQPKWWEPFVVRVAIRDMKTQTRVLLNDFGPLATVNENGPYVNLPWGDRAETYSPSKRGNLVTVTLETIINDDLRAVQRIPQKLASAAATTINEFVANLFSINGGVGPLMADGYNVFDEAHHQGNAGSAALDSASLQAALTAMMKYGDAAGKRLGIRGRFLLVPPDLAFTAAVLLNSTLLPGSNNNDVNVLRGVLEPIVVPNWSSTSNWYVMADPAQIEGMEIGFLNGREEPELLVQSNPTDGAVFTNDAMAFKVRWVFGGAWLDYRAAYGSLVV